MRDYSGKFIKKAPRNFNKCFAEISLHININSIQKFEITVKAEKHMTRFERIFEQEMTETTRCIVADHYIDTTNEAPISMKKTKYQFIGWFKSKKK